MENQALDEVIDRYFDGCDSRGELYSEAGLALALDVSLQELRDRYDAGEHAIQMAYLRVMRQIECGEGYEKMASLGAMKLKQRRFGGYQDKADAGRDKALRILFGPDTDETDFD